MRRNGWKSYGEIEKLIHSSYGIKVYEAEPVRKILKLVTDQGILALKIANMPYERYLFTCQAIEHVQKNGFYNVPEIVTTKDGNMGISTRQGVLTMSKWINAREARYTDKKDVELVAMALAKFHKATEGYIPCDGVKAANMYGKWIDHLSKRCEDIIDFKDNIHRKQNKRMFDKKVLAYSEYFLKCALSAIEHLNKNHYMKVAAKAEKRHGFCHHDVGGHNFLVGKNNEVFLIDFDDCIIDMPVHDFASFLLRIVRSGQPGIHHIIRLYDEVNHISRQEYTIMKALMEFPQDFWEIIFRYYNNRVKYNWTEDEYNTRLDTIISNIDNVEKMLKKLKM